MASAVVTGAARGIGRAIAGALARRGFQVVAADVDETGARETAAALMGPGHTARRLDVVDLEASRALARETVGLEVWVNNAGILATGPGWSSDEPTRRRLFDVNVHGTINGTDAALAVFRPRGHGHVVNVVSLAGLVASPGETLYGATKHAALAFSVGTQLDLLAARERGVRVSALCPDGVWTAMVAERVHDPEAWPSFSGGMLRPEDVAEGAMALLDRPRPVRAIPRRRGALLRLYAAMPGVTARALPLVIADAHRKQRRWAKRVTPPE